MIHKPVPMVSGRGASWWWVLLMLGASGCAEDELNTVGTVRDEFKQNTAAKIDVLWVVDNSESMAEEQAGLGQSFQTFIDYLLKSGVDYHIGVISTDSRDGGLLHQGASGIAVITPTTENAAAVFMENVTVGTTGSRIERAFETAATALGKGLNWRPGDTASPPNTDFIRADASLFVVMVSDEDDKSFGPVGYYTRLFETEKGIGNNGRVSVSAVVGLNEGNEACADSGRGIAQPGARYIELATLTGGIATSVCADFNESLRQLSFTATGLKSTFVLSGRANLGWTVSHCGELKAEPFCVRVDDVPLARDATNGWEFDETQNAIIFGAGAVPKPQAKITVEYRRIG